MLKDISKIETVFKCLLKIKKIILIFEVMGKISLDVPQINFDKINIVKNRQKTLMQILINLN